MSTDGKDKSGRVRIRCSAANENGTCPDPKTFYLDTVETAVLTGLKTEMRSNLHFAGVEKRWGSSAKVRSLRLSGLDHGPP